MTELPKEFLEYCRSVTAKRPRTVIEHIIEHGSITTEELKEVYGYNHPPRAARDVRELGIPLETFRVTASDGRKIAAYRFGSTSAIDIRRSAGRTVLSNKLKQKLIKLHGNICMIYLEQMNSRDLQIDHRIPFEVAGESLTIRQGLPTRKGRQELNLNEFMLLSGSANRAKSWSCEHCENWKTIKNVNICRQCYWAYPERYSHVAMRKVRRLDIIWSGRAVRQFDHLKRIAATCGQTISEYIKRLIDRDLSKR